MSKEKAEDLRIYDIRTLERNFKRGSLSRKDYEKYLKGLPDVKDKADRMPEWRGRGDGED